MLIEFTILVLCIDSAFSGESYIMIRYWKVNDLHGIVQKIIILGEASVSCISASVFSYCKWLRFVSRVANERKYNNIISNLEDSFCSGFFCVFLIV